MRELAGAAIGVLFSISIAHSAEETYSVRVRFVPAQDARSRASLGGVTNWSNLGPLDEAAWSDGKVPVPTAADWSRLGPAPGRKPGVLFLMAHAGIGDTFPVQDGEGRTLFSVTVVDGNDDHLLTVVRSREGSQKIDLQRDKSVDEERPVM